MNFEEIGNYCKNYKVEKGKDVRRGPKNSKKIIKLGV